MTLDFEKYETLCPPDKDPGDKRDRIAIKAYRTEQFRIDMLDELGISGHPKALTLFRLAWEAGHHNGYEEVYICALDLVELIR